MSHSTENYIWFPDDMLGEGATSTVFAGRNKKTGEVVAVKVFNSVSYNRPVDVQMREFEVLQRLNHANIVKLIAVEELHLNPKQRVLVMELFSAGSLLNQLQQPENAFGILESEFLAMLQCVVHGMNHLQEKGIVHRDIKPGNIMRQIGEDGRSVYKLTDFGSARELVEDERFFSIYGTEEYLHPDMYERAVLKKPQQKSYGASVDLWSIGVTFYHAATGRLPFIPFGGPRRNVQIMYKITTGKPEGAIAGVQNMEDGPIEWSYSLPQCCQLTEGLKAHLVPVLAGILKADQEKCWGFDKFFTATTDVLQRISIHIFSHQQATAHSIYTHFHNTVAAFFEDVHALTGIEPVFQHYLYEGHPLVLEPTMKVVNLPPTRPDCPLFLISRRPEKLIGLVYSEPEIPVIPRKFDPCADHAFTKITVQAVHQYLRLARSFHRHTRLILQGAYSYTTRIECRVSQFSIAGHFERLMPQILNLLKGSENTSSACNNMMHRIALVNMKLLSSFGTEEKLCLFTQKFLHEFPDLKDCNKQLALMDVRLNQMYNTEVREYQNQLQHLRVMLSKHSETFAQDKSVQKMEVLLEKIVPIHQLYYSDKKAEKLSYNEEQIHKFEKFNLLSYINKVKSLLKDDCWQKYQEVLYASGSWNRVLSDIQTSLEHFSGLLRQMMSDLQTLEDQHNQILDRVVLRAIHPSVEADADGATEPQKSQNMILKMNKLKKEIEIVAQELQNNNSMIKSLEISAGQPVEKIMFQPKRS